MDIQFDKLKLAAYFAVISARYRTLLQYRAAAFAGFATQLFWGVIRIMVMMAFYAVGADEQPMSLPQVIAYIWLGQAFLGMFPWNVDTEIAEMIRSGAVCYEFVRPLDLYSFWFCRTIALRTATTTLRSVPMLVFAILILPLLGLNDWALQPPPSLTAFFSFVVSIFLGLTLACAFTMLMHVILVLSLNGDGVNRIFPSIAMVLSGNILPLPLFPDWIQGFLELQPFQGLVDVPFRIYCGNITGTNIFFELIQQLLWCGVMVYFGRWALMKASRNLLVQGG